MADDREPPPLFEDENEEKDRDSDDLFSSATEPPAKKEVEDVPLNDDKEDLFADATAEVSLEDEPATQEQTISETKSEPKPEVKNSAPVIPPSEPNQDGAATIQASSAITPPPVQGRSTTINTIGNDSLEEIEGEGGDQFSIDITVTDPKKIGDGMNAYMAYKVNTKTTLPQFKKADTGVYRRFSDFLGLHEKLNEKYLPEGRIIPPPPEKSVLGMTKIKMSKEEAGSADFVEKRRASLERFLNRTAKHPVLQQDSDLRQFLESELELPRSTSTSALSSAGMLRLFSKVGDSFNKMTFKMDETDQWFDEKHQQVESLDHQLRKLHSSIEALVNYRKEVAQNTGTFAKSCAMLANAEEHTALSRALSQLAEVEEKVDALHLDQADSDFFVFAELIKDYVTLIGSVKEIFNERVKLWKSWKEAEATLTKKREAKAKLELARKTDKVPQAEQEIKEWEGKCEKLQEEFEVISKNIRTEFVRFEKQRIKDFKATIINYLESLMNSQQQLIKYWEAFLPEAKAIA